MAEFFTLQIFLLVTGGFFIGIFAATIGGAFFFSVPFVQWLFPGASFGAVIGNLKVGSFFRSIGTTASTHKKIEYLHNLRIAVFALAGTIIGASLIADLSQKWLFPAVIVAVLLAFYAPKLAHLITNKTFALASFLLGAYAGLFGAGIGILLIALLRLKYTADTDIAHVKIQARFVEFLLVIVAVFTHFLHGNLITSIWVPWSLGSIAGGYVGGVLLDKMGSLSGRAQKYILYCAFALALIVSGYKFFIA